MGQDFSLWRKDGTLDARKKSLIFFAPGKSMVGKLKFLLSDFQVLCLLNFHLEGFSGAFVVQLMVSIGSGIFLMVSLPGKCSPEN